MEQEEIRKKFIAEREETDEAIAEMEKLEDKDLVEKLNETPINLLAQEFKLTKESVRELAPGKRILVCDSYVEEMEVSERFGPGFVEDNILLVDHHLPIPEMSRQYSSTNLAIDFVREFGPVDKDIKTFVTHTDCDSVLSSAIMRGILEPKDEFGAAAIAADHTGEENKIADLLQSLNANRNIGLSLESLQELLEGKELNKTAQKQLKGRLREREIANEAVGNLFKFTPSGKIAYVEFEKNIDAGLLPALMPEVEIIAIMTRMYNEDGSIKPVKQVKVRLGRAAPDGTDLRKIMAQVDPNWGGRWNAGNNKRHGGTDMTKEEYIARLETAITSL